MADDIATLAATAAVERLAARAHAVDSHRVARVAIDAARPFYETEVDLLRRRNALLEAVADAAFRYVESTPAHLVDDDVVADLLDALAALDGTAHGREAA